MLDFLKKWAKPVVIILAILWLVKRYWATGAAYLAKVGL